MLANYAKIVRRAAAATAVVAAIMIVIGGVTAGSKGLIGALLGTALVAVFYGVTVSVVKWTAKSGPPIMMAAGMGTYLLKIVILLALVGIFQNSTAFNARIFGLTAIVCVLAYSVGQVVASVKMKQLYVDVEPDPGTGDHV
jgi:ATP synthase protein I